MIDFDLFTSLVRRIFSDGVGHLFQCLTHLAYPDEEFSGNEWKSPHSDRADLADSADLADQEKPTTRVETHPAVPESRSMWPHAVATGLSALAAWIGLSGLTRLLTVVSVVTAAM